MDTERPDNDAAGAADEDKPRRRHSPVVVASVAAAVLLAGGGGAYFATTASGGGGKDTSGAGGDGTPPPLALDGYTEGGTNGTDGTTGIAPGEPDPSGATYRAEGGLPDGPSSAAVHRAKGEVTAAQVAGLAKALGVEGKPKAEGDAWKVGATKDGSGPGLRVTKKAPGTWTFNRFAPGTDNCKSTTVCASGTAKGAGTDAKGAGTDPVSVEAAKKAATPVLKAVGQDDAKLDASQLMGSVRVVNADPKVGGLPTYGWSTGLQIGPDGQVVGGSGQLKTPAKGDTYPVISARKTLGLLNGSGTGDGRVGIGGCASPVPLKDKDEVPCETSTVAPKPAPVLVEDAVFGLATHFVDGRQALVPSWLFEVRPSGAGDSFTVTHPAVEPRYLTSPRPPNGNPSEEPTVRPSPRTSEPGDGTTAAPADPGRSGRGLQRGRQGADRALHGRGVQRLLGHGGRVRRRGDGPGDRHTVEGQGLHHDRQGLPQEGRAQGATRGPEGGRHGGEAVPLEKDLPNPTR